MSFTSKPVSLKKAVAAGVQQRCRADDGDKADLKRRFFQVCNERGHFLFLLVFAGAEVRWL